LPRGLFETETDAHAWVGERDQRRRVRLLVEMVTLTGGLVTLGGFVINRMSKRLNRRHQQPDESHADYVRRMRIENRELDDLRDEIADTHKEGERE
jgi:hypothetical protein